MIEDVRKSVRENEPSQLFSDEIDKIYEELCTEIDENTDHITLIKMADVSRNCHDMTFTEQSNSQTINIDEISNVDILKTLLYLMYVVNFSLMQVLRPIL